jgi:hypothetical protein
MGPPCSIRGRLKGWFRCCLTTWKHLQTLVYSDSINNLEVLQQWTENARQEIQAKPGISEREYPLVVMLTCMGTTYSMCCTDNMKISHIVARISFWRRWLRLICSFKWVLTPLKSVTLYFSKPSMQQLLDNKTKYK